jgi:hypothetical protein
VLWEEWKRISEWVGNLPLVLDLLNKLLALSSISPRSLLQRADAIQPTGRTQESETKELHRLREALCGQDCGADTGFGFAGSATPRTTANLPC